MAGSSQPVEVPVLTQPGLFLVNGNNAAALHAASYALITNANPAKKGEVVAIFATGVGPLTPAVQTNTPASDKVLSRTLLPSVKFGGLAAQVEFSGLAPGFIGLYQINAVVPAEAESGSLDLVIVVNGVQSNAAKIEVQ